VGGAASFQDPSSGDPGIVIQPKAGEFVAFDAVCPHAGCTVEFAQSQDILVCPCHGSLFNASTGAVEQGPAASGLRTIPVTESSGQLYVT
jgi:thiosulfate dehydrogenase [quinone] large subunit